MSTKVYNVYKLKDPNDLWPLVHDIRLKATKNVRDRIKEVYFRYMEGIDKSWLIYREALKGAQCSEERRDYCARLHIAQEYLRDKYREASTKPLTDSPWSFDLSVGVRHFKGDVFLHLYPSSQTYNTLDFVKRDKRVTEYHYQNAADKPRGISNKAWDARRDTWDGMDDADQWKDVLELNICKWDMWYLVDPWLELYQVPTLKLPSFC